MIVDILFSISVCESPDSPIIDVEGLSDEDDLEVDDDDEDDIGASKAVKMNDVKEGKNYNRNC